MENNSILKRFNSNLFQNIPSFIGYWNLVRDLFIGSYLTPYHILLCQTIWIGKGCFLNVHSQSYWSYSVSQCEWPLIGSFVSYISYRIIFPCEWSEISCIIILYFISDHIPMWKSYIGSLYIISDHIPMWIY